MRNPSTSKALRITAGIMGLMMLVFVLFFSFYIAAEADHDCSGDDCPICACIQQCGKTLRGIGTGTAARSCFIVTVLFVLLAAGVSSSAVLQDTLVSRKIRLNN